MIETVRGAELENLPCHTWPCDGDMCDNCSWRGYEWSVSPRPTGPARKRTINPGDLTNWGSSQLKQP